MVVGFDIGGTTLKAGLVDGAGRVRRRETRPTPGCLRDFRDATAAMLSGLAAGLDDMEADGLGIGCPGIIGPNGTTVDCLPGRMDYLEGVCLGDLARLCLPAGLRPGAPVHADNDARAALAGELRFGAARGRRDALMLTLGSGVGGAVVANGSLVRGRGGVAGHVGHMTMDPFGPLCFCGNRGCLETYFSARAIEIDATATIRRGCDSILRRRFGDNPAGLTCEAVFDAAAEGDRVAGFIVERAVRYLGGAIAALLHVLDCETVILGGQIAQAGAMLFDTLRADVAERTGRLLRRTVPIIPAEVGADSGIVGAASLAMDGRLAMDGDMIGI